MTNYSNVFSGSVIRPAEVSYLPITLTADITLEWPLESNAPTYPAASTIDVTSTVGVYVVTLPDATQGSAGTAILFNGLSANTQTASIKDNAGVVVATLSPGTQWLLVLAGTATAGGTWRAFQLGATTSAATAASLAGYGIVASSGLLSQAAAVTTFSSSPRTVLVTDRASLMVWTGSGSSTFNLPAAATAGNNFFVMARNSGGGDMTIDPSGSETINGSATVALHPGDSAFLITDGIAWYSVGLGRDAAFAFDFTSISIAGAAATYTLSGAELNRVSYKFTGLLTNDVAIVVPATVQQYWVENATTGAFAVTLKTSGGTPVSVTQGGRDIYYCNGTNVVRATTGGIAVPIGVTDGGTGLASYAVGDIVYASGATTLGKLADVAIGNALIAGGVGVAPSYGKIGLTTHVSGTLPVANGGTGITAFGTGVATALGINVGSAGAFITFNGALGTPSSGIATNLTGLPLTSGVTGTLAVANGGTGITSFGTGVATALGINVGSAGALITFNGALGTPSSGTATNLTGLPLATGVTGTLGATNGGTGQASVTTGDIIYGSAANTWSKLAGVATGNALISGGVGTAPSWGKIALTTHVSGTLPVANGGTGITALGTGVATALGINVGSAGAPVVLNGALGTPSSGTATNLTGLSLTTGVTGTLPVANGGTGVTSSTGTGNVVLSASPTFTGAPLVPTAAPGTNTTQAASTAFVTAAVSAAGGGSVSSVNASGGTTGMSFTGGPVTTSGTLTLTGTLAVANGGTGITSFGTGVATALGINVGSAGAVVTFNGTLGTPSSGTATNLTGLPLTTGVTGTLPVANGGTGITSFGTGVATALGVNVGSAGAFVTFNGALGTPSSGVLTNCTADGTRALGTKRIPQLTSPTTFTSALAGGHYYGAGPVTINASVFAVEDSFLIVNSGASSLTITQGASVTLQLAGTATTGSRTLAGYGVASVLCVATDTFRVSGAGVT